MAETSDDAALHADGPHRCGRPEAQPLDGRPRTVCRAGSPAPVERGSTMAARRSVGGALRACVAASLLLAGCRDAPARSHPEITVSAAADLMEAWPELAAAFESETGVHVVANYGSSGQLAQQVAEGAPVDVIMSADMHYIEELGESGLLVRGTRAIYGIGKLMLWTPPGAPPVESLNDLVRPTVRRIAIANPETAPYGHAAEEALRMAGLWSAVRHKLAFGENVRQAMLYARSGDADVAFVPASLATGNQGRAVAVPEEYYPRMYQMLAVVRDTRSEPAARTFVAFVTGREGLAILARHGFEPPPEQH